LSHKAQGDIFKHAFSCFHYSSKFYIAIANGKIVIAVCNRTELRQKGACHVKRDLFRELKIDLGYQQSTGIDHHEMHHRASEEAPLQISKID
jgi:hypothetical protein